MAIMSLHKIAAWSRVLSSMSARSSSESVGGQPSRWWIERRSSGRTVCSHARNVGSVGSIVGGFVLCWGISED